MVHHYWTIAFVAIGFTIMLSGTIIPNDVYYEVMIRWKFKGLELFAYRLGNYMGLWRI